MVVLAPSSAEDDGDCGASSVRRRFAAGSGDSGVSRSEGSASEASIVVGEGSMGGGGMKIMPSAVNVHSSAPTELGIILHVCALSRFGCTWRERLLICEVSHKLAALELANPSLLVRHESKRHHPLLVDALFYLSFIAHSTDRV